MSNRRFLTAVCFFSLLVGANGQDTIIHEENVIAAIDPATEVRLGTLQKNELVKKYHLSTNRDYMEAVNRVGRRIADSIYERPDLTDDWEFTVLDSGLVNAEAFGGGKVIVFEGFLDKIFVNGKLDEDMLAAVIGHEMAHNVRRHVLLTESVMDSMEWILAHLDAIERDSQGHLTPDEIEKLKELARARFTRVQEFEADLLGALYATRAGFNGFDGALRWMQMEANDPHQEFLMSEYVPDEREDGEISAAKDHPTWKERIAKLLAYKETILNLAGEFNWGHYLLKTYNFEKAAQCFRDVTKVFPNSFEAWNNLGAASQWQYLQIAGKSEKFQPGLVDYFVQLRDRVREPASTLNKAIRAYQQALSINPYATGTKSNLAVALIQTHEPESLDTAEQILQPLLKADPKNPTYINDLAILTYWKTHGAIEKAGKQNDAEGLFEKAARLKYLPAKYNLAVLQLEIGKQRDGISGLQEYLKTDGFSPWATLARNLLKQQDPKYNFPPGQISPTAANVLNIRLGSTPEEVKKAVGEPERTEKPVTSDEEEGIIFHYDNTLGMNVVFADGKVIMINVFAPQLLNTQGAPPPEVAGIEVGGHVDDIKDKIGKPIQIRPDPNSGEKAYYYSTKDSLVVFTITPFRIIHVISIKKAI